MNLSALFKAFLARFPAGATLLYCGAVLLFAGMTWTSIADILERREAVAAAADILNQLEGRRAARPRNAAAGGIAAPAGSPVLEGATVTVGGANLLQRVAARNRKRRWQYPIHPGRFTGPAVATRVHRRDGELRGRAAGVAKNALRS